MKSVQAELGLFMASSKTEEQLAEELLGVLDITKDWMTRKEVKAWMSDRECRLARAGAKGRIISGQSGYKATKHATLDEIKMAANTLHSMASALLSQESELWKVLHGRNQGEQRQ